MALSADVVRLTNCRLILPSSIEARDLWIDTKTGRILDPQSTFFTDRKAPARTVDLEGRLIAPGFIDLQLNGCFGIDFGAPQSLDEEYAAAFTRAKVELLKGGVTSFAPTVISTGLEAYRKILPHLSRRRDGSASAEAESLGAHLEGPFLSPQHTGIHQPTLMRAPLSIGALDACYGREHLRPPWVSMVTLAPELDSTGDAIRELKSRGITVCLGHTDATYEQARTAIAHGVSMVTHLYNAMPRPHHRKPGILGLLGAPRRPAKESSRSYFGIIADGIHVHPSMVHVAYATDPERCVLVTDAIAVQGLPDGIYEQARGEVVEKRGLRVSSTETGKLAGSCVTMIECLNNFIQWTGASLPEALRTVTSTPAEVLGLERCKGYLEPGADADLVELLEVQSAQGGISLEVHSVWKLGQRMEVNQPRRHARARL